MPDNTRPLPTTTVSGGSLLRPLDRPPREGEQLAVMARGRVRLALVTKVTPTRVRLDYRAPSTGQARGCWAHRSDVAEPASERAAKYGPLTHVAAEEASRWPLVFRVESGKGRRGDQLVRLDPSAER